MKATLRPLTTLLLLPLLAGCAGGWRGGTPPAEWAAEGVAPAPAAASVPSAGSAAVAGTHATSDGAVFVWKGEGSSVNVAGEFNAWSTSADPLGKQPDGSWRLEKKLAAGRYAYKFVVDGSNWKPDPTVTEGVDDGYGGKNSVIVVGTAAAPAPTAAAPPAKGAGPAVTAAGVVFRFAGAANTVNLAGDFNSWSTTADPMTKGADGSFTISKSLAPGRYAYKFVLDGTNWKEDPGASASVDDGYGGKNSVVVVEGAGAAAPATAGVGASPTAEPAAPVVRPLAAGATPRAPQPTAAGVVFTYAGPAKSGVALCGEFNAWSTTADPMTQAADGTWTLTRKLAAGTYAYKFLVDGSAWKPDDGNPRSQDDGFGGKNSVVVVP